jgi:molybdenum cofactor cytidylyltransferase
MAHSLGAALRFSLSFSLPSTASWIVALGDMPFVQPATIAAVAEALHGGATIAAPVFDGRRGNPVGFNGILLPELLALRGDEGARSLFRRHSFTKVTTSDAGILRDIDLPADL